MEDMKDVFDAVIQRILFLIQCQMDKLQRSSPIGRFERVRLLLVGGFGASQYLRQCIEEKFPACEVIQPPEAYVFTSADFCRGC